MPRYSFLGRPLKADPDAEAHSERLHKMLAGAGVGSRRDMEALIESGQVTVNGQTAKVGDRVKPGDLVKVKGRAVSLVWEETLPKVMIYHKEEGEIVSRDDPEGRASVFDKLPRLKGQRWISIGRLDYNTEGLLVFTTSGELANRLSHPRYEVEREYAVRVLGELTQEQMNSLTQGIELDDGIAQVDSIYSLGGEGANQWYQLVIREGRNREVRRLFEALGLTVSRLIRVRFGPIAMPPKVKRGMFLDLTDAQVRELLKWCDLESALPAKKPIGRRDETGKIGHPYRRRVQKRKED
ncbi:MAG: pseudouridine synthase [Thiobacillus sp.]|nr:pseudouridine synthase [Thiobacillus sp.]